MEKAASARLDRNFLTRSRARAAQGVPKYAQLRNALLEAIERGTWEPGAKLPTEQALAEHTPFSLGTVQRALRVLVDEGIVVRQQGSGTFVAKGRKAMDTPWHCRFLDDTGTGLLPVYPKVIARGRIRERGAWSRHLGQRGDNVMRIDRAIRVNDEFAVYSRFYLEAERFASMLTRPIRTLDGANFKAILSREFGLPVRRLAQTLTTTVLPNALCGAMKVKKGSVGTLLEIAAAAGPNRPVYFQELFIPPNSRRLLVSDSLEGSA